MGKVFDEIRQLEREGKFLGKTVQFVPHATNHIKSWWKQIAKEQKADIVLIEIGGTIGDYENTPFLFAAKSLEAMGAEGIVICTNTMHKVANIVQNAITIPLLHIADATGEKLKTDGVKHVGLLGTAFTMSERFYSSHLTDKFDLNVLTPTTDEQTTVHEIIYNELCKGVVCEASRNCYIEIINNLKQRGAEAIILGCTEIALLISQTDTPLPLYDTTQIHADAAVAFAIT